MKGYNLVITLFHLFIHLFVRRYLINTTIKYRNVLELCLNDLSMIILFETFITSVFRGVLHFISKICLREF